MEEYIRPVLTEEDHMQNAKTTRNTRKLKAMIDAGQLQMGL